MSETYATHHATAILWGARAVLLRGASGSGKSRLALELLAEARRLGIHAALIGDDRLVLEEASGRLIARAVPEIDGLVEARGLGLVTLFHEPAGVVGLVVERSREVSDFLATKLTGAVREKSVVVAVPADLRLRRCCLGNARG